MPLLYNGQVGHQIIIVILSMGKDPLVMGYFDNHDNRLLNKYKKILKIDFFYRYVLLLIDW
jgi:hypothetical protein